MSHIASQLASRHAGNAGGRVRSIAEASPATVVVVIPAEASVRYDVQHTAALLINLLCRCDEFVVEVELDCPATPLRPNVIPRSISTKSTLSDALLQLGRAVGSDGVPIVAATARGTDAIHLVLGAGAAVPNSWRVDGSGWIGTATRDDVPDHPDRALPIGPYVAACLAAAAVFFEVRGLDWSTQHMSLSGWDLRSSTNHEEQQTDGPDDLHEVDLDLLVAGLGAVANTFLLTLSATASVAGRIQGFDHDNVESTNRNRCVLFFERHDGAKKSAATIDTLTGMGRISIDASFGSAEEHIGPSTNVVSAVDTPESRQAIQMRYPRSIIQASTRDLRVELQRTNPAEGSACIRCYNPPRYHEPNDEELRADLKSLSETEIADLASDEATGPAELLAWRDGGQCSAVAGRILDRLRHRSEETQFAVGFVSALAGVLLAAQAIKDAMPESGAESTVSPPLSGRAARTVYSLLDLGSPAAGPSAYARDPRCPACDPSRPALQIWQSRHR